MKFHKTRPTQKLYFKQRAKKFEEYVTQNQELRLNLSKNYHIFNRRRLNLLNCFFGKNKNFYY